MSVKRLTSSRTERIDSRPLAKSTFNQLNQLVTSERYAGNFEYDLDGNMTKGYLANGEQFSATYDIKNRLTQLSYQQDGQAVVETFRYFYTDMLARKI